MRADIDKTNGVGEKMGRITLNDRAYALLIARETIGELFAAGMVEEDVFLATRKELKRMEEIISQLRAMDIGKRLGYDLL